MLQGKAGRRLARLGEARLGMAWFYDVYKRLII